MSRGNRQRRSSVLITGSSTGLGAACALEMDRQGWRVFAGVLTPEEAEQLVGQAAELNSDSRLVPVTIDVTQEDSIAAAAAVIEDAVGDVGLHALVNNAGIAVSGPLEIVGVKQIRRQFEVNVVGQIAVTQAMLPMLRTARGRIVNMGSVSGRLAIPYMGPYCASKFAISAITDSLRVELARWGISVSIVEPANITSKIWDKTLGNIAQLKAETTAEGIELYEAAFGSMTRVTQQCIRAAMPVEKVTEVVRHALTARRPKTRYLVAPPAIKAIFPLICGLPDRVRDWIFRLVVQRQASPLTSAAKPDVLLSRNDL